jgi:hypothetical protein
VSLAIKIDLQVMIFLLEPLCLVMIKHFFEWLELVPLPNCNNEGATYAFLDKMFNKFSALAKVCIDQST